MMRVRKKDGELVECRFDKITDKLKKYTYGLNDDFIDVHAITQKVIPQMIDGITTAEIDTLVAETAAGLTTLHPDYSILAARIAVDSLHKNTKKKFSEVIKDLYKEGLINETTFQSVKENSKELDNTINLSRDFDFDYFGFKTLERAYLLKIKGKIWETPQQMYMRVSVGIWGNDIEKVKKTYENLSLGYFTHATPTLFNAGTNKPQLSSCFLLQMKDDSIDGIFDTLKDSAKISKLAGGIGINMHNIRAKDSYIKGTGGYSNGIIPFLKIYNETARAVDQGGGKRKGSIAIYLEPWHADIFDFLDLRKNHGKEERRARDLFTALWVPDLFMKRLEENGDWSLFCPNECPGLSEVYGEEFEQLYTQYEQEGKAREVIKAQRLMEAICTSQEESGTPYIAFKDAANRKSNQKNLGTIKGSNLCIEILEYTSKDEVAVCNLASISLPKYVSNKKFNYELLYEKTYEAATNLDKVIDVNYYPLPEAKYSNMRHRPIGLGVQGLADVFALLSIGFDSEEAIQINKNIFETIYFAALKASNDLAKKDGHYETFKGSPMSEGILQYHMWGLDENDLSGMWDFKSLIVDIKNYGIKNSLLTALMPTASTSQILGNNECFEAFTSNVYTRRTLSGEFPIVNKHLVNDLIKLDLWSKSTRDRIIRDKGSVQNIQFIPQNIKEIYKTVWEIPQKKVINMAADRGPFICQTQSMNLYMKDVTISKIASAHMYSWKKGLKTGIYYLRTEAAADALSGLGLDTDYLDKEPTLVEKQIETNTKVDIKSWSEDIKNDEPSGPSCSMEDGCIVCGS